MGARRRGQQLLPVLAGLRRDHKEASLPVRAEDVVVRAVCVCWVTCKVDYTGNLSFILCIYIYGVHIYITS